MSSGRVGNDFTGVGTPVLGVGPDGKLAPIYTGPDVITNDIHVPSTNTDAVITYDAQDGKAHAVAEVSFSYGGSGTLSGGRLTIADGSDNIFDIDISSKTHGQFLFEMGKVGHAERAMTITLAAGGANVQGRLSATHYTITASAGGVFDFNDATDSGLLPLFF